MHVDCRPVLANFRDHGGQHGQESQECKGNEGSQEEKEVTVRRKSLSIRITSKVRWVMNEWVMN
jgi:hypothetical protein